MPEPMSPALPELKAPKPPLSFRKFGDATATRGLIFDNVLKAAQGIQPVTNPRHTLQLTNVAYDGPDAYTKRDVKNAILRGDSLSRRLRGEWQLLDNATGQVVQSKKTTLANVPYYTDDGTFVKRGVAYGLAHQLRLSPGVYARERNNGQLEAHVNVLPGKGRGHKLFMDPKTGVFKINLGQAEMPLYPLLRAMGAKDQELRDAWGATVASANAGKNDPAVISKLYQRVARRRDPAADPATQAAAVAEAFGGMELNDYVNKRTLGTPSAKLDLPTIMAVTNKLIALNRGTDKDGNKVDPDDRDHLAYQSIMGPEDLIAERLQRSGGELRRLLWKASAKQNLNSVGPGFFDKMLDAALIGSGLGSPLEEINPAELLDQQSRVTRMGEGGISSSDAVPDESRTVQPSHLGFIDFLRTPESGKVGVDMRLARSVVKGNDGRLYAPMTDARTGQTGYKSAQDLADAVIAFRPVNTAPQQDGPTPPPKKFWNGDGTQKNQPEINYGGNTYVKVLSGGKLRYERADKVDYVIPHFEDTFSSLANMIPLKSMVKGQRAVMASRMLTQALPLNQGESPLVQAGLPETEGRSFEEEYAKHMGAVHAEQPARVVSVDDDSIQLQHQDGSTKTVELWNNMPYNRKTFIHQTAAVKPGDTVAPGQLLARSNFTDAQGVTALGKNLRVAYLPFRGMNFEDAGVISESARHKMTSEHAYQHDLEWDDKIHRGKNAFASIFPATYTRKQLEAFDDDGIIKPGTTVRFGDPLVLVARERERTHGALHRGRGPAYSDETITWQHHAPGTVTDSGATDRGAFVTAKASAPAEVGDKLSGRYGDKGVIAAIIPDDEMPTDADGKPFEILVNPLGIISRTNPAQLVEAALGKVAAITGKPYKMQDFKTASRAAQFAMDELRKNKLNDVDDVIDPETGRKIPGVFTGNRWFMKLHHMAEDKAQGRGIGGYTMDGSPAKGGKSGAKRFGMLNLAAVLSHGGGKVIRDAKLNRGQANPQYWAQTMAGFKPPAAKVPDRYHKFVNMLRAGGMNPVRSGTKTHFMAMTDKAAAEFTGDRELQNVETVRWDGTMKPVKGGLFDESLTGGHDGLRWSKITLHEPLPNPVMEEPIRRVLGLTEKKMRDVLAGREQLNGHTGPAALKRSLEMLNVEKELHEARQQIASSRGNTRDQAVRRLGFLKSTQRLGIHPSEWMVSSVPVLPPKFRPVATMGQKKLPLVSDANYLYKELFEANSALKELHGQLDDLGDERLAVYDAYKAVTGLGAPTHPKNQERGVKGVLKQIFGSSPKFGMIQRQLLGTTTDMVGRATIIPNPELDMDQVGIPEEKAWDLYTPFVIRNLVRRGLGRGLAAQYVENKSPIAREALVKEMTSRPVMIDRAPVLHRYGVMAFYPQITKGSTLQISPLVVGGFNADFDGDAMQFHVPGDDDAAEEMAEKMLPSKNLFSAANFRTHYKPSQEYVGGLYAASARINKRAPARTFATTADAIRAYNRGDIGVDTQVEVLQP